MSRTEYAVTFTAREQAELLPVAAPEGPLAEDEMEGQTLVSLVSAGTELAGAYAGEKFPVTPGYAAVFRVGAVGSSVKRFQPGDRAFCMGPHRSYQRVREAGALRVPDGLPDAEAAFARMMGVSMSTLTTTAARPPQKVLVTGLGLVGHLASRIFASCGYEVIACDPSPARREIAVNAGLKRVLPAVPVEDPAVTGQVALALECSGHEAAALDGCRVVRKRGEVVLIGTPWRRRTDLTAHELLYAVFHRYVVIRSGWEWELPLHPTEFRTNSIYGNIHTALEWLAEGRASAAGLYHTFAPGDAQNAYGALLRGTLDRLAAVFDWSLA